MNKLLVRGEKFSHPLSSKIPDRWEPAKVTYSPTKFGSPKHCGIGDGLK